MKKILLAITAALFILIYAISSSEPMVKKIALYRYQLNTFYGSDKYAFGDLYGLSYIPQFRIKQTPNGAISVNVPKNNRDINMYAMVDSHLFEFMHNDSVLYGVKSYQFATWNDFNDQARVKIKTSQKNVLLIEIVEQHLHLFADSNYITSKMVATTDSGVQQGHAKINMPGNSAWWRIGAMLFDKKINANLEFNLFNYRFFSPLKELKAALNYKVFNRADKDVQVSRDGKYLFLMSTVDTSHQSSYFPISGQEVNQIVSSLNQVNAHYKAVGFDDVYLAIVPNPVSMLQPGPNYNHLVERVQNDPALKIKFIDLYDIYRSPKGQVYKNSDSHYTNYGYQLFIEALNKPLKQLNEKNK